MSDKIAVSRRKFVGGLAAALGYVSTGPNLDVFAQGRGAGQGRPRQTPEQYDALAKLSSNENNWGIPDSVMDAMEGAWKYAGRYGYPDPGISQAIAEYDGIKPENIMYGAGSGEILNVVGVTFLATNDIPGTELNRPFQRTMNTPGNIPGFIFYPHVGQVFIEGPFDGMVASSTQSREKIFTCRPSNAAEEGPCARIRLIPLHHAAPLRGGHRAGGARTRGQG